MPGFLDLDSTLNSTLNSTLDKHEDDTDNDCDSLESIDSKVSQCHVIVYIHIN